MYIKNCFFIGDHLSEGLDGIAFTLYSLGAYADMQILVIQTMIFC